MYYRAGYTPNDYPSEKEWAARERLECSLAIKCPSVDLHLVTFKVFQEHFGRAGFLDSYLNKEDKEKVDSMRTGFWSLLEKTPEIVAEVQKAIVTPEEYVLKSHREGGGNNYYGEDLKRVLQKGQADWGSLSGLFLMRKIHTPQVFAHLMRNGEAVRALTVSEYSRYGIFLSSPTETFISEDAGHLLRTKKSDVGEGGVATGYAVINIPYAGNCEEKDGQIVLKEI